MIFMHYFLNNILFWFLENIIIKSLITKTIHCKACQSNSKIGYFGEYEMIKAAVTLAKY